MLCLILLIYVIVIIVYFLLGGSEDSSGSQFSPSTLWILGFKFRLSGLAASTFTGSEPFHWPFRVIWGTLKVGVTSSFTQAW